MKWYSSTQTEKWQEKTGFEGDSQTGVKISDAAQGFDGFGACFNELGYIALSFLSESEREDVLDLLFSRDKDGLRLAIGRIPIGASDYAERWYSHSEREKDFSMEHFSIERDFLYLIPYIEAARARNPELRYFASPWSPPVWMKNPPAYNFGTLIWEEKILNAYALYFVKFVQAYEREGIRIGQIHVQNEPMSSQKFPSCVWTGEQFAEFIGKYLGPAFDRAGIDAEIWLGTLNGPENDGRKLTTRFNQYANLVLHDADAGRYVKGVSYQWAGKFALSQTRRSFPELKYMQSENECGDGENKWEYAKYITELFHYYIANGVNSYVYWNGVLAAGGMSTWGWNQNSMISISEGRAVLNHEYYVMKHFSRFVESGAVVLNTEGHCSANTTAFKNPNGEIVVVITNPFNREMPTSIEVGGEIFTPTLPADSLNTFVIDKSLH